MVELKEAKRSQEEETPEQEVECMRREVQGNVAPTRCGSKDYMAEMEPALANISRKGFLADKSFNQPSSNVVGEANGEKANEEILAVTGDYDNVKAEGGQDHILSEEAVVEEGHHGLAPATTLSHGVAGAGVASFAWTMTP